MSTVVDVVVRKLSDLDLVNEFVSVNLFGYAGGVLPIFVTMAAMGASAALLMETFRV